MNNINKVLVLQNVNAEIGAFKIRDISFSVYDSEVLVVLGENGAGKTKLLETIAGFLPIVSGKINLFGEDILNKAANERNIGFIFQGLSLFPHLSVKENILYGARFQVIPDLDREFKKLVHLFKLDNFLDRFPKTLSGGEQQKVALARTLITNPKIVLLDEPTSALSPKERERVSIEIKNILKKLNKSAIFVTHNVEDAHLVGDRIALMENGRVLQIGTSNEIFYKPNSKTVATFFGETNIYDGVANAQDKGITAVKVNGLNIFALGNYKQGTKLKIFIRPENILLKKRLTKTSARNNFKGIVKRVSFNGPLAKVSVDVGFTVAALITKQSLEELEINRGSSVYISFKITAVHTVEE